MSIEQFTMTNFVKLSVRMS